MADWEMSIKGPRGGFQTRQYQTEAEARRQFARFSKKGYRALLWGPREVGHDRGPLPASKLIAEKVCE